MTTPVDAIPRSRRTGLDTHFAPRGKSSAARPVGTTAATISPAAQAAFASRPAEAPAAPAAASPTAAEKAYRRTATT